MSRTGPSPTAYDQLLHIIHAPWMPPKCCFTLLSHLLQHMGIHNSTVCKQNSTIILSQQVSDRMKTKNYVLLSIKVP